MHDNALILTIAVGLTAALFFGLIARRLGLSPIVGYLVAGIAVGPHTPGFVGDLHLSGQLAEIGVILLMFGVGLHFHLKDLLAVRSIAIPGAIGQSVAATLCSMLIAVLAGWSWKSGMVLGIATSVASTVVLLRVLMDHGIVDSPQGHAAVGWLIVEDIITVLVLVLLPPFAAGGGEGLLKAAGLAVFKLALLGGLVALAGARFVPWLLLRVARLRSRELFTLTILVMSISVAAMSYFAFGASMALGAFLAGMVVGQSKVSHQAAADALPMRDAFAVLFFVSVGMLFDYTTVIAEPWLMLGVLAVILLAKPLVALLIVITLGHSLKTALTVAGGLAQIGEFSFILSELAKSLGLLPGVGHDVLVAGAIVSISVNPILFRFLLKMEPMLLRHPVLGHWLTQKTGALGKQVNAETARRVAGRLPVEAIVVGYGPVGQTITRLLRSFGIEPMIIEMNVDTVTALQDEGHLALYGDASRPDILKAAGISSALSMVVTLPGAEARHGVIHAARELNPSVHIISRARYLQEKDVLEQAGATMICYEEAEVAVAMAETLLKDLNVSPGRVQEEVGRIQGELRSISVSSA